MNHHQMPLSRCLYEILGADYYFISTSEMKDEQKNLGYKDIAASFILHYRDDKKKCKLLIDNADAVIFGSAPVQLLFNRFRKNKMVFIYSERVFKGENHAKNLLRFIKWNIKYCGRGNNTYLLCASAFTYGDYMKIGLFKDKAYRWGYFPEVKKLDIDKIIKSKNKNSILWVGRLISWKHPEYAIKTALYLKKKGYDFELNIIGIGSLDEKIKELISAYQLQENVHLLGAMSPERVREYMESSEIFLFTSDQNEGWGAVLNESMSSGCAVIASDIIGAAPFLIKNGKNGLIYKNGDIKELCKKAEFLLTHNLERIQLDVNAYATMLNEWNPAIAAKRFLVLYECLKNNCPVKYKEGPCSKI